MKRQFRPKNPLTRQTERHAQFTTLFRAHDPSAPQQATSSNTSRLSAPSQPISYAPDGLPIMRAVWSAQNLTGTPNAQLLDAQHNVPTEAIAPDPAAPASALKVPIDLPAKDAVENSVAQNTEVQNVGAQNVDAQNIETQNIETQNSAETSDPIQLQPEPHVQQPTQADSSLADSSLPDVTEPHQPETEQPQTSQPSNPQEPSNQSNASDVEWSRLQNIMRHHEADAEAEGPASGRSDPAAATGSSQSGATPIQRQRDTRSARLNRLQGVPSAPPKSLPSSEQPVVTTPSTQPRSIEQKSQPEPTEPSDDEASALNKLAESVQPVQLDPTTEPSDGSVSQPISDIDSTPSVAGRKLSSSPEPQPVDPQIVQRASTSDTATSDTATSDTATSDTATSDTATSDVPTSNTTASDVVQTKPEVGTVNNDGALSSDVSADVAANDGIVDTDTPASTFSEEITRAEQPETLSDSEANNSMPKDALANQSNAQADVQRTTDPSTDLSMPADRLTVSPSFEASQEGAAVSPDLEQKSNPTPPALSSAESEESTAASSAALPEASREADAPPRIESEKLSPVDNAPKPSSPATGSYSQGASLEQSGWLIQRTESGAGHSDRQAGLSESPPLSADQTTTNESQIQQVLGDVPPAQSTESSVELVVPRRSREAILSSMQQRDPNTGDSNAGDPNATDANVTDANVADTNATNASPETAVIQQAALETPNPSMTPTLNDSQSETEAKPEIAESELIETEIGALPSDLWEQIGQVPPRASDSAIPHSKAMSEQNKPAATSDKSLPESISATTSDNSPSDNRASDSVVQRATHDISSGQSSSGQSSGEQSSNAQSSGSQSSGEQSSQMSVTNEVVEGVNGRNANGSVASETSLPLFTEARQPTGMADIGTFIEPQIVQREPAAGEAVDVSEMPLESADAQMGEPADGSDDEGESQPPDVDTDELARQVYAQLKRRLVVEQERIGRR